MMVLTSHQRHEVETLRILPEVVDTEVESTLLPVPGGYEHTTQGSTVMP